MTVQKLIDKLQKYDKDAFVFCEDAAAVDEMSKLTGGVPMKPVKRIQKLKLPKDVNMTFIHIG